MFSAYPGPGWGERFIDSHPPGFGKMYVVLMALSDVFSYSLIYLAVEHGMVWLYLSSVLIGSVGPFVVSGALAYEAKAIGKENRGTYASIQKLVVGTTGLVTTLPPLALVFQRSPQELWLIVAVLSVVAFLVTLACLGQGPEGEDGRQHRLIIGDRYRVRHDKDRGRDQGLQEGGLPPCGGRAHA
ncbi:hypothetical protein [Thermogymnomonas acidicola]|uniref:hypothetical protein n=1 Tax=Thermogymnomonas acidicola TaxID=399579 RepID=UPI001396C6DB|nr:hypothetical protein [Thermogymnomonas acidicola]